MKTKSVQPGHKRKFEEEETQVPPPPPLKKRNTSKERVIVTVIDDISCDHTPRLLGSFLDRLDVVQNMNRLDIDKRAIAKLVVDYCKRTHTQGLIKAAIHLSDTRFTSEVDTHPQDKSLYHCLIKYIIKEDVNHFEDPSLHIAHHDLDQKFYSYRNKKIKYYLSYLAKKGCLDEITGIYSRMRKHVIYHNKDMSYISPLFIVNELFPTFYYAVKQACRHKRYKLLNWLDEKFFSYANAMKGYDTWEDDMKTKLDDHIDSRYTLPYYTDANFSILGSIELCEGFVNSDASIAKRGLYNGGKVTIEIIKKILKSANVTLAKQFLSDDTFRASEEITIIENASDSGNGAFFEYVLGLYNKTPRDMIQTNKLPYYSVFTIAISHDNLEIMDLIFREHSTYRDKSLYKSSLQKLSSLIMEYGSIDMMKLFLKYYGREFVYQAELDWILECNPVMFEFLSSKGMFNLFLLGKNISVSHRYRDTVFRNLKSSALVPNSFKAGFCSDTVKVGNTEDIRKVVEELGWMCWDVVIHMAVIRSKSHEIYEFAVKKKLEVMESCQDVKLFSIKYRDPELYKELWKEMKKTVVETARSIDTFFPEKY